MRRYPAFIVVVLVVLFFGWAFSIPAPSSALADECVQTTRSAMYSQPSNTTYNCQFDGKKLLIDELGKMRPAPEGVYKQLADGKECFIGKGGFVLYCRR